MSYSVTEYTSQEIAMDDRENSTAVVHYAEDLYSVYNILSEIAERRDIDISTKEGRTELSENVEVDEILDSVPIWHVIQEDGSYNGN